MGWSCALRHLLGIRLEFRRKLEKEDILGCQVIGFRWQKLHRRAYAEHVRVHVQEVSEITNWDPKAPLNFPLRPVYEWFNGTYEGLLLSVTLDPLVVERKKQRQERPDHDLSLKIVDAGFSWPSLADVDDPTPMRGCFEPVGVAK